VIKDANGFSGEMIYPGQVLKIPKAEINASGVNEDEKTADEKVDEIEESKQSRVEMLPESPTRFPGAKLTKQLAFERHTLSKCKQIRRRLFISAL
jgi:LysM repeat protein